MDQATANALLAAHQANFTALREILSAVHDLDATGRRQERLLERLVAVLEKAPERRATLTPVPTAVVL